MTRRRPPFVVGSGDTLPAPGRPGGVPPATLLPATLLPAAILAGGGVLAQICYPLLSGPALRVATVLSVLLLAGAALGHAAATGGWPGATGLLVVAGGIGLLAEAIGVATGVPFGRYHYSDSLGAAVLGVPLLVPAAWMMLAYPCLLLGRRLAPVAALTRPRTATALLGGLALSAWDLFLDPQMVAEGHWTWRDPTPALPGVPGVPLTNYAGWLVVAIVMIAALDRVLPGAPDPAPARVELVPAVVLAWTWLGSTVGNLAFFDRPAVAVYGSLMMGATVLPYLLMLRRRLTGSAPAGRPRPHPAGRR